jgi:hypothetical protein
VQVDKSKSRDFGIEVVIVVDEPLGANVVHVDAEFPGIGDGVFDARSNASNSRSPLKAAALAALMVGVG